MSVSRGAASSSRSALPQLLGPRGQIVHATDVSTGARTEDDHGSTLRNVVHPQPQAPAPVPAPVYAPTASDCARDSGRSGIAMLVPITAKGLCVQPPGTVQGATKKASPKSGQF